MGIPVIMTKHDDRFGFIDRFLKAYTDWDTDCINWNPQPIDIEYEKNIIKQHFFSRVKYEANKINLNAMWNEKENGSYKEYEPQVKFALQSVKFPKSNLKYAILGVISSVSYFIPEIMEQLYPNAELVCGIDSYVKQSFFGKKTIKVDEISQLDKDVIIITAVPGAYKAALPLLEGRMHIIIKGKYAECVNFDNIIN